MRHDQFSRKRVFSASYSTHPRWKPSSPRFFCHAETHVKRSKYHGKSLFPWQFCCRLSDDRYAFLLCLPWLPTLMYTHCLGTRASRYLSHWDRYRDALVPCGIVSQSCIDASVYPIPYACYSRVILFSLYSHFSGWSCIPKDFKHKVMSRCNPWKTRMA